MFFFDVKKTQKMSFVCAGVQFSERVDKGEE